MAEREQRNTRRNRGLHLFGFGDDPVDEFMDVDDADDDDDDDPYIPETGSDTDEDSDEEDFVNEEDDDADAEDVMLNDPILPESLQAPDKTVWVNQPIETEDNGPLNPYQFGSTLKNSTRNAFNMFDFYSLMLPGDNQEALWWTCWWTNQYATRKIAELNVERIRKKLKPFKWDILTVTELNAFLGLIILAGIEKGTHQPAHEFWSKDETIRRHAFPATMSRNRFKNILRFLRFDDAYARKARRQARRNQNDPGPSRSVHEVPPEDNKFEPIRDVATRIINSFYRVIEPGKELVVDEQIIKFKGRCGFRVYMKSKPGKYGMKLWAVVDLETGFILDLQPYTGKEGGAREVDQGRRVVLDLVSVYAGSGRNVTADNFFSSLNLCHDLRENGLTYLGTIRHSRKEIPDGIKDFRGLEPGSVESWFYPEDRTMITRYVPRRNKAVFIISSGDYSVEVTEINQGSHKPAIVEKYDKRRYGVDRADEMLATYYAIFPTRRWPVRFFLHLVHTVSYNAYSAFILKYPEWRANDRSRRRVALRELVRLLIVPQILRRRARPEGVHLQVRRSWDIVLSSQPHPARVLPVSLPLPPLHPGMQPTINPAPKRKARSASPDEGPSKKRCGICVGDCNQRKQSTTTCCRCNVYVCNDHRDIWCQRCTDQCYR